MSRIDLEAPANNHLERKDGQIGRERYPHGPRKKAGKNSAY